MAIELNHSRPVWAAGMGDEHRREREAEDDTGRERPSAQDLVWAHMWPAIRLRFW